MPSTSQTDEEAAAESFGWEIALCDAEMSGFIPDWVVEAVTREYVAGRHGKWRPRPVEFAEACRKLIAKWRYAAVERRRLLDARVEVQVKRASPDRVAELFERFKAGLPKQDT